MLDLSAMRQGPLEALAVVTGSSTGVDLSVAEPCARFALRCAFDAIPAAAQGLGVAPPQAVGRAAVAGSRVALCLGPDEWLLIAPPSEARAITQQLEKALADVPYVLVDVSHRSVAIVVSGPHVAALLNHGCPLDLSLDTFGIDACTRTLFEKSEIILWRKDAHMYHVETDRSYAPYLWTMLIEAREAFMAE